MGVTEITSSSLSVTLQQIYNLEKQNNLFLMSCVQRGFDFLTHKDDKMLPQNISVWLPNDAASYPRTESSNVRYTSRITETNSNYF